MFLWPKSVVNIIIIFLLFRIRFSYSMFCHFMFDDAKLMVIFQCSKFLWWMTLNLWQKAVFCDEWRISVTNGDDLWTLLQCKRIQRKYIWKVKSAFQMYISHIFFNITRVGWDDRMPAARTWFLVGHSWRMDELQCLHVAWRCQWPRCNEDP